MGIAGGFAFVSSKSMFPFPPFRDAVLFSWWLYIFPSQDAFCSLTKINKKNKKINWLKSTKLCFYGLSQDRPVSKAS